MIILTKYGNMDVTLLDRGSFMPDKTDDPGEIYYIRAPKPIWIDPYDSCTIDTGIYINLPDGCEGVLRSRTRPATDALIRDLERKYYNRRTYDLCPECMKELEDFLNNNIK